MPIVTHILSFCWFFWFLCIQFLKYFLGLRILCMYTYQPFLPHTMTSPTTYCLPKFMFSCLFNMKSDHCYLHVSSYVVTQLVHWKTGSGHILKKELFSLSEQLSSANTSLVTAVAWRLYTPYILEFWLACWGFVQVNTATRNSWFQ